MRILKDATRAAIWKDQLLADESRQLWTYLPCSGLVSVQALTEEGNSIEIAMVGREGLIGQVPGIPTPGPSYRAVVSFAGETLRVRTDVLMLEFEQVAAARQVLLARWSLFLAEIAQSSACHRFHPARQRLARWLLTATDRTGLTRLCVTQKDLAPRLGLRRSWVSTASLALQNAGAIGARHGRIVVLDRLRLERAACECYRLMPRRGGSAARP